MAGNDPTVERLRAEIAACDREIESAQSDLDHISRGRSAYQSEIQNINYRIDDLKRQIDREYEAMRTCRAAHNRNDADNHRMRAQDFKNELSRQFDLRRNAIERTKSNGGSFQAALDRKRSAIERKKRAKEQLFARFDELKREREQRESKWKEKSCKKCGRSFRYSVEWPKVPDLCPDCQKKAKDKWREKPCKGCGNPIRYNTDWEHIPNYCADCKAKRKK